MVYIFHEWRLSTIVSLLIVCSSMDAVITSPSSLANVKNKHLLVNLFEGAISGVIVRNASGHRIDAKGVSPLLLDWICQRYGYEYEYVDLNNAKTFEDSGPKSPGVMYYASIGQVDVIMAVTTRLLHRLKYLDFVQPWFYTPTQCLVPVPEAPNSIYVILKPFTFGVWMLLILSAVVVTILLLGFNYLLMRRNSEALGNRENKTDNSDHRGRLLFQSGRHVAIRGAYLYVLGTLLNQGGYLANRKVAVRFIIGTWCLLSLVLLNVYNGTLVSYMTAAPRAVPLVNQIEDVVQPNADLHLVVDKGLGTDVTFTTAEKGLFKQLGDNLRNYAQSRCNRTQQCVDLVKSLPHRHVYVSNRATLMSIIQQDYAKTKKCHLTITASTLSGIPIYGWALAKHSPHLENFNRGTLNAIENGLVEKWKKTFQPNTRPCYEDKQTINSQKERRTRKTLDRLTLGNLAGAFALLGFGSMVSIVSFVLEIVYSRFVQLK